ncbi:MAG: hypothetical protein ACK4QL_00065 [Pseudanabaenaceae cyanobacterium]
MVTLAKITDELDILLGDRIQSYPQRLIIIATIISGFVLLAVYLFVSFDRAVMTTVYQLELAAQGMTPGDYTAVNLHSKDELAQVVTSFNRIAKALVLAEAKFKCQSCFSKNVWI